ncbi:MAG: GTP pyrophosphokinase family protein [Thomasclavelia spiroformis]|jgi:putative GTP pyrophosphokinase|uniref:GTP pyrophosphokinase family protein n=1 Tax=Thomasclavelia spiroformis TaxID=29348 RepID=A0A3E5FM48_9FIRM|nr:GTP pyrophosphokinase family protein [Thomasclavelia spiroformis]MBS6115879.1 GTP pyrophosphokinase family protein [Thomasclavelia spiroformis]RGO06551.1 GTP pyrophosphokinase family protein [Thomasclavelia spiroformis]
MNQKIDNILDEQKKFQQLMQPYKAAIKIIKIKLEIIDQNLEFKYGHSPIHNIQYRIKSPKSIINKLERKKLEKNIEGIKKINDISGLRVICNYINDIHYIAQLLILQEDVVLIKYNNYITYPKKNGYRSLHLIVTVPVYQNDLLINVPVEIQIRTIAMDCWASLEHELVYKADKKANEEIKQRLKKCAEMMEKTDLEMQKIYMELNHPWQ